jgi:hypothetical protein
MPNWFGTGLSNQLFFIVLGIINAYNNKQKILIIDKFRLEPCTENMCYISEILDLNYLNLILKKFDIELVDSKNINFKLIKVTYGSEDKYFDITEEIKREFYSENKISIPSRYSLNNLKGDPIIGIKKILKIYYEFNNKEFIDEYDEYLFNGVNIDLNLPYVVQSWNEIDCMIKTERPLFTYLLKNMRFVDKFYKLIDNIILMDKNKDNIYINDLNTLNKKINVIHLRLEKDMTFNMAGHNNMEEKEFIKELEIKYIGLIEKYFNKNDIIFILSYELENNVIKFLKDNNYEFYFTKKNLFEWREPHAIIDLLLSEKCSGTFIGNWQHQKLENMGSSFSYVIDVRIKDYIKRVFIDLYDIRKQEIFI